jgi:4-carboxymuconolactone decarboxylase
MIHGLVPEENKMHVPNVLKNSLPTVVLLGCALAASAQQSRFQQLRLEDTSGEQRALAERMLKETRVGLGGPWNIMLRSPEMSEGLLSLYNYFRWKTALPQPLVELAILTTAREWSVQFEWFAHYPLALKAGVSPSILADLRVRKRPENMKPEQAATYDFTVELCRKHVVSDATFHKVKTLLGEKNVVDLTSLVGTYISVGALLNVAEVKTTAKDGPDYLPALQP